MQSFLFQIPGIVICVKVHIIIAGQTAAASESVCLILNKEEPFMKKYECEPCGYVYDEAAGDPDNGIAPGTKWEDLPEDWVCPICGMGKDVFKEV